MQEIKIKLKFKLSSYLYMFTSVKRNIYPMLFCLSPFLKAYTQDSVMFKSQHVVAILTGYNRHIVKDDIISPMVYSGSQIPILLKWQLEAKKTQHTIALYYDQLKLTSSITVKTPSEAFFTKNNNAFIEYSFHRKLYTYAPWNLSALAGTEVMFLLNFRDHYYSNYTHYNTGEMVGSLGLSLMVLKTNTRSNSSLSFRSGMALVAYDILNYLYNVNVPKKIDSESYQNTYGYMLRYNKPVTINRYVGFQTEISYTKFISKHIGIRLNHYFQFYKSEKYDRLFYTKYLNNQFLIGITMKL